LEYNGLPRFIVAFDSLAVDDCPSWTLIFLGALAAGIYDLVTFFKSVKASGNYLLNFVNELSFELFAHIVLYVDQNEITIIHSSLFLHSVVYFLPLLLENLIHQNDNQQILL
jgi:hypothetical protein